MERERERERAIFEREAVMQAQSANLFLRSMSWPYGIGQYHTLCITWTRQHIGSSYVQTRDSGEDERSLTHKLFCAILRVMASSVSLKCVPTQSLRHSLRNRYEGDHCWFGAIMTASASRCRPSGQTPEGQLRCNVAAVALRSAVCPPPPNQYYDSAKKTGSWQSDAWRSRKIYYSAKA